MIANFPTIETLVQVGISLNQLLILRYVNKDFYKIINITTLPVLVKNLKHDNYNKLLDFLTNEQLSDIELAIVKGLIKNPLINVNAYNHKALLYASRNGYLDIVRLLLEYGNYPDGEHMAFVSASMNGHLDVVRLLLEYGVNPWSWNNSRAIVMASSNGHLDIVRLLLEYGRPEPVRGYWAIVKASANGHLEIVELLLTHGVDPIGYNDEDYYDEDYYDNEPIRCASHGGHADIVRLLLKYGANPKSKYYEAIRSASYRGHVDVVRILLKYGVDRTALDTSIRFASEYGHSEVVRILLEYSPDPTDEH